MHGASVFASTGISFRASAALVRCDEFTRSFAAGPGSGGGSRAPRDMQQRVAMLFNEVLGCESVDPQRGFFELGGDSLSALQLIGRLQNDRYTS